MLASAVSWAKGILPCHFPYREVLPADGTDVARWDITRRRQVRRAVAERSPAALMLVLGFRSLDAADVALELSRVRLGGELDDGEDMRARMTCLGFESEEASSTSSTSSSSSTSSTSSSSLLDTAWSLPAGVWQGYSVGTHTLCVLDGFFRFAWSDFPTRQNIVSREAFAVFLAVHDAGKGFAVESEGRWETRRRKTMELAVGRQIVARMGARLAWPEATTAVLQALLLHVTVGECVQRRLSVTDGRRQLHEDATSIAWTGLSTRNFVRLAVLFHRVDASAYRSIRRKAFTDGRTYNTNAQQIVAALTAQRCADD